MVNSHRKTYPWQPHHYCAVPQVCLVCQRKWSNYHCHCIVSLVSQPERHSTRWVHLSISQYITVYHSIPQGTIVYHSIPQYTTVYHSISQYILPQVTVDTNHPVVSLHALFPSLLPMGEEGGPQNAMGFRLLAGPEVTIVASKSSGNESFSRIVYHQAVIWLRCCWTGRYRIQSESFPAIAGFLEELLTRLACYYTKQVSNPSLPLPSPHFPPLTSLPLPPSSHSYRNPSSRPATPLLFLSLNTLSSLSNTLRLGPPPLSHT